MAKKNIYRSHTLKHPARGLYVNLVTATKATDESPTKYSVVYGLEPEDAKAMFALEAELLKEWTGKFTAPEDYQLAIMSGEKAADKAIANAERRARRASEEDAFKIKERAQQRADLYRPFAGILTAGSRVAFHDRFLDRYKDDLQPKEREQADKFGIRLSVLARPKIITLDTELAFQEHKDKFYPGAYYGGSFNLSPYDAKKDGDKDGVAAYLGNQVFVKDGERLGGGAKPIEDEFGHYKGGDSDYSPSDAAKVDEMSF